MTAGFFGKNLHWAKVTKNDQKWSQNRVLGLFKKTASLVLSGICVKRKFLWFINILQKLHGWEKSGSQVIFHDILLFFNRQYFISRLISDFDFWYVDRHE